MIWMLRHAHAEDGSPDAERPLSAEGERQARAVGGALVTLGVELDACLTSPRVRARDTAKLVCEQLGIEPWEEPGLQGGPFDPLQLAAEHGESVLLIGHDPDVSMAIHDATGAQVRMPKAGLAAIDRGELKLLLRPQELEKLAGLT
ncbi:MAG TPA: histidine phosphatase family protein [Thermoleophilaceae bacterium]|nr:histidine phosphatase family protein [Thermoleophilaceae bacterium]